MNWASRCTGLALAAAVAGGLARAQTTERVSVDSVGAQGSADSWGGSLSSDGRLVAFHSDASNLVAGDSNGVEDVFVHDRQLGTTVRVSVSTAGAQANNTSFIPSISGAGRFVVFSSFASNLVVGDSNGVQDIFVHDLQTGTTERVSVATGGAQANNTSWPQSSLSADGRFVAFASHASNLVAGDTNMRTDIFVRDRLNLTTERVSVDSAGMQGTHDSGGGSISADGRFVAFGSDSFNLVAGDTNGVLDCFVRDRLIGTTERVSVSSSGAQADSTTWNPSISADGRFVAFYGPASNLVPNDMNGTYDAFVHDRLNGITERVSVDSGGAEGNNGSGSAFVATDGRFVAFSSSASNLVAGDTNGCGDVFVRDRLSGTTERMSVDSAGLQGNLDSGAISISDDGRFVAIQSLVSNLVTGDTNGFRDVFVRDRGGSLPPSPFCFGDGSSTACPCGNAGFTGNGCGNSVNANGAILFGSGNTSISSDTLVLAGSGMPNAFALYIQGTSRHNGGLGSVFGDGLRCAGGSIIRLGTKLNVAGASQYPSGTDAPVSIRGLVTSAGTRTYQVWYRNAAAFCTVSTFNLSNGLEVQWIP